MEPGQTCLILGAGASRPYGYPLGWQLKERVIQYCLSKPRDAAPRTLLSNTHATLEEFACRFDIDGSPTIDAFLAKLIAGGEHELSRHGRMAIVAVLSTYERPFIAARGWYPQLAQFIGSDERASPLKIVTFNYDRSLEAFFCQYLETKFGTPEAKRRFAQLIEIKHVYGSLAELPLLARNPATAVEYGSITGHGKWKGGLERVKLIGEGVADSEAILVCKQWIRRAEAIIVLGFGFDPVNMALIGLDRLSTRNFVFCSGFGLTADTRGRVRSLCIPAPVHFGAPDADIATFLENSTLLSMVMRGDSADKVNARLGAGTS
jgi:hypothetical protein